jgi:hypothetical protein
VEAYDGLRPDPLPRRSSVEATQTPSAEHVEFDRLCAALEEWLPLPAYTNAPLESWGEEDEETPLDEQILAGLVSPV